MERGDLEGSKRGWRGSSAYAAELPLLRAHKGLTKLYKLAAHAAYASLISNRSINPRLQYGSIQAL